MPPILTARGLRKSFGERPLLDDAELAIGERERVGLVGNNGAGKSTLAKILAGIEPTDGGEIAIRRDAKVEYLSQRPVLAEGLTAEQVVLGGLGPWREAKERHERASAAMAAGADEATLSKLLEEQTAAAADVERLGGWDREREAGAMLTHLGLTEHDAPVSRLSGGERRRVDLARLLVASPDLAILDEPTNHLDVETIEWLEKYLSSTHRGALLLVTHDRYMLEAVCQRTLELEAGRVYSYTGGWSAYLEAKAERLAQEAREEKNRQNFLRTELEWLRRSPSARRTKAKARVQRAEEALATDKPQAERVTALQLDTSRQGKTVLDLKDLSVDVGGRRLIDGLELRLVRGERIGVLGRSGAGKTSLLRVILGEQAPAEGEVVLGKNVRVAYFDQARSGLNDEETIQENVAGQRTKIDVHGRTMDIRSYLARFLFDPASIRKKLGMLSGGERARVALAKLLLKPANLLIFDEPTNDLDVATLGALEEMLLETEATALVVSHDRYFLDRIATSILAFEGDGRVVRYVGGYEDYRSLSAAARTASVETETQGAPAKAAKAKRAPKSKKGLSYKEKRELDGMMKAIEAAEAEAERLDAQLADPAFYQDRADEVADTVAARDAAHAEVERLMARWEELEAKKDA